MTANTAPADGQGHHRGISRVSLQPITAAATPRLGDLPDTVSDGAILKIYLTALSAVPGSDVGLVFSCSPIRNYGRGVNCAPARSSTACRGPRSIVQLRLSHEQMATVEKELDICRPCKTDLLRQSGQLSAIPFSGRFDRGKQLGLPAEAIRESGIKTEFDYFVEYLKSQPERLGGGFPPTGWSSMNPSAQP